MERQIRLGLVEFREDHTQPPFRKRHLRPVPAELVEDDEEDGGQEFDDSENETEDELATQVRGTVFYKQSQVSVKYLRAMMGAKVFDNPKDHEELGRLFKYVTSSEPSPIVLDFFAGSAASAEAVIRIAANGNPRARFLTVQLPEAVNAKERSGKAALAKGWETISQLSRERIRRVLQQPGIAETGQGFRAYSLTASNLRRWSGTPDQTAEAYETQLDAFTDSLEPGWKPENVIWEVALREGLGLTANVEQVGENAPIFFRVSDEEREKAFTICLEDSLTLDAVKALGLAKDDLFVCRATALDDTLAANLALQCRLKVL
jgi:adenine-specific DNA-methyltransferase